MLKLKQLLVCFLLLTLAPACGGKAPDYVTAAFPAMYSLEKISGELSQDVKVCWRITDDTGLTLGYSALAQGQGFHGPVQVAVAWIPDQGISHVQVVQEEESPDYGGIHLHSPWFTQQFLGNPQGLSYNMVKMRRLEPNDVVIITGATASSHAVISAINQCLEVFRDLPPEED